MARCAICGGDAGFLMTVCVSCANRPQPPTIGSDVTPAPPPPLVPGVEVRVEGRVGVVTGKLLDVNDAGVRLDAGDAQLDIPWTEIRAILQRVSKDRLPIFTAILGILGAMVFGVCGSMLDALNNMGKLVPAYEPTPLTAAGVLIGALVAGLVGLLIDRLRPKTRWAAAALPQLKPPPAP